jgi:hypothetical protein
LGAFWTKKSERAIEKERDGMIRRKHCVKKYFEHKKFSFIGKRRKNQVKNDVRRAGNINFEPKSTFRKGNCRVALIKFDTE